MIRQQRSGHGGSGIGRSANDDRIVRREDARALR